MVFPLYQSPVRSLASARHQLCCSRADRCRSHYQASSSHATGGGEHNKSARKKSQVRGTSAGSALSSLTIQPLQRSSKSSEQPWSSGILCTEDDCSYKANQRTVAWLKDLFTGLDTDRYSHWATAFCLLRLTSARFAGCMIHGCCSFPQGWCHHQG